MLSKNSCLIITMQKIIKKNISYLDLLATLGREDLTGLDDLAAGEEAAAPVDPNRDEKES